MINLIKLTESAQAPVYATEKSACFDVSADILNREITFMSNSNEKRKYEIKDALTIPPQYRVLIPTGFIWKLSEGYELNFLSRSGNTWKNGIIVLNSPAVIDEDYDKESFVILYNASNEYFRVEQGQRIAQGKVSRVERCGFESGGERLGGFGSTGS